MSPTTLLRCHACLAPIARLDTGRYPVGPTGAYCLACSSHALIQAVLSEA